MWGCDMLPFRALVGKGRESMKRQKGPRTNASRERWSSPYVDVAENRWFSPGVRFVTEQNWMRPVGSRRFCPCGVMDKRAFHAVLRRAFRGACGTEEELFPREYEEQFRLEGSMTRQDMAVMLFRCTERMGIDTTVRGNLAAYSDASEVSAYAQPAMSWAVGTGLLRGIRSGSASILSPWGGTTRAQAATVLLRWCTWAGQPEARELLGVK